MKKSTKAGLLSALVFPGIGHFVVKKRIHGAVLSGTAFVSLYFLIARTIEKTLQVFEKIANGEIDSDATSIAELVLNQTTADETLLLKIATTALVISWLFGIVDSYRTGRIQEKNVDATGGGI